MNFKKGIRNFSVTGKLKLTNNTFNIDKQKEGSNYVYSNANLVLDYGQGNVFCNLVGGHFVTGNNILYALGIKEEDGKIKTDYQKQIKVPYEKRFDDSILKTISMESFTVFNIEKDADGKLISKKFLSKEDAVKYLQATLVDGMILNISGDISFRIDEQGKTLFTLNIKRIYLNERENPVLHADFTMTVITDKDSYDSTEGVDENGMVEMNCFVTEYMKEYRGIEKSVVPLPFKFYFDTKVSENWKKIINEYFRPRNKYLAETTIEGSIKSIGNTQSVSLDDVTEDIRQLVEFGLISSEELARIATNNNSLVQMMVFNRPRVIIQDGKMSILNDKEKYKESEFDFTNRKKEPTKEKVKVDTPKATAKTDDALFAELFSN